MRILYLSIICAIYFFFVGFSEINSYAAITYTPGTNIGLTGSTANIRFDVASVLISTFGNSSYSPILVTSNKTFSGAFYSNSVGWIQFNSGTYQVSLNCGAQSLGNLLSTCQLTGTGWSELVGEVYFGGIQYLPTKGILSGSIQTYAGDFSVSGIYLPLKPAILQEDLLNLRATTNQILSVSGSIGYAKNLWTITITPVISPYNVSTVGSTTGVFLTDTSYAGNYFMNVTDPDGGITTMSSTVYSANVDTSNFDGSMNFIHKFCLIYPGNCVDGNTPAPTSKYQLSPPLGVVSDGRSTYSITIKPRDKYGNRVSIGSFVVTYDSTASSISLLGDTQGPISWIASFTGDSMIFTGQIFSPDILNHLWQTPAINLVGQDPEYSIASVTPTDAVHQVKLKDIKFTNPDGSVAVLTDTTLLDFLQPFTAEVIPPASILIGEENQFSLKLDNKTNFALIPYIIPVFAIGDGSNAYFHDFKSSIGVDCQTNGSTIPNYIGRCDWLKSQGVWYPSVVSIHTNALFSTITGTYLGYTVDPPEETVTYASYVHYTKSLLGITGPYLGSDDIVYQSKVGNLGTAKKENSSIVILGQNTSKRHGGVTLNKAGKTQFLDTVRKNVAVLSRNRSNYANVAYSVSQGNIVINNPSFASKQTIVTIGGDITITQNIHQKTNALSIIALTDSHGNGGNIYINPSVTDINATLVAEHSIQSSGNKQLYIYGSIFSSNTLGGTIGNICPYYLTIPCTRTEAKKYDLEKLRNFKGNAPDKAISSRAAAHPATPLIVEYDMRIETNPPPILQ